MSTLLTRLLRRLVCVLADGGHRFNVKFGYEPTRKGTNVTRTLVCVKCEHTTDYDSKFGW